MAATAGLVTTAGAGVNAGFSYNRENYMFDSGQRWARYMAGYTFANDQVGLYRDDIDSLGDISVAKMDNIHAVSGLMMVIVIQLIMAGRLGVHGPAPPSWLMGLYWPNCGLMTLWLMLAAWLANHAGARAQAGQAYLKTRSVRLPIPTPKQLDKARVFGNHWERQRFWDVFRVPFIMPATYDDKVEHHSDDEDSAGSGAKAGTNGKKKRKTQGPVTDLRTPGWVNEEIRELQGGSGGAPVTSATTPEHFELLRGLQHEWWSHETYARVCIYCAFTHWLSAASLYIMCHCFIELRAMWPAYSCVFVLVACHYCINMIDIQRIPRDKTFFNVPMELIVPFVPLIAVICMGLDYSILEEWRRPWVIFIWVCSWVCYLIYFAWSLRLYDILQPNKGSNPEERLGKPWWPAEWQLPASFQHAFYLVAPPKHLEPGETCLWQEMKCGRAHQDSVAPPMKERREANAPTHAWSIVRGAALTTIFCWGFMLFARLWAAAWTQVGYGDMRWMLKQEGRTLRWPSHMQPWMTPWTRLGTRNEYCHTGGCDRRLGEFQWKSRQRMAHLAERLSPQLQTISDVLEETKPLAPDAAPEAQVSMPVHRADLAWPAGFRPDALACSHVGPVAALARQQRRGALMSSLPFPGASVRPDFQSFTLGGIDHLGEVLGSHWGEDGMMLATKSGNLAECLGMPANGMWPCREVGNRLPMGGSSLRKAVVARVPSKKHVFRAVVVYDGDASVTLFEANHDSGVWFPTGEARLPSFMEQANTTFSLSMEADKIFLLTEGGGVLEWAVTEAEPAVAALPPKGEQVSSVVWQTACRLSSNHLARLGLRQTEAVDWVPEIFVSTSK